MANVKTIDDLAVFGAEPMFEAPRHVGRPNVADPAGFYQRLDDALVRRWLTNDGPLVRELEQRLADLLDVRHAVAVCNATLGLQIVAKAAGLSGEVIVPSFTFIATAHALSWIGLTPVFADVAPGSHHIDPAEVESLITPQTSAIVGVHLWGEACDIEALADIARRRRLDLIFDAAHALGCTHGGRMLGGFGSAEVFSLHATKFVQSLEGGVITTDDSRLAERLRQMRDFGYSPQHEVASIGTNAKLNEAAAAMALSNLDHLNELVDLNRANYQVYQEGLQGAPGLAVRPPRPGERSNYQYVVVEVDAELSRLTRDDWLAVLSAENVLARKYFYPGVHRCQPYVALAPELRLPETERVANCVLQLPTGAATSEYDIESICRLMSDVAAEGPDVAARLRATK